MRRIILEKWRGYSDPEAYIFSETDGVPHNTITPIARKRGDLYELDLVLKIDPPTIGKSAFEPNV